MAACRTMKQHRAGVDSCETIFLVLYNKKAKPRKRRMRDRQGQRRERKKGKKEKERKETKGEAQRDGVARGFQSTINEARSRD